MYMKFRNYTQTDKFCQKKYRRKITQFLKCAMKGWKLKLFRTFPLL